MLSKKTKARNAIENALIWIEQECTTEENQKELLDTLLLIRESADFLYTAKQEKLYGGK